jgi:hypothetical protein
MPTNSVTSVNQSTIDQIDEREPAPERAESVEDRLGVTALGDRAEPHRHFLHVIGDGNQNQQEPDQVEAVFRAGRRIGGNAACVVVGHHHDNAGTGKDQIELDRFPHFVEACSRAWKVDSRRSSPRR